MVETIAGKLQQVLRGRLVADEPMAVHTSWKVGGPADLYLIPADGEDLVRALRLLQSEGVPWMVIGFGSNLLVRDGGIRGAVIDMKALRNLEFAEAGRVRAGAGLPLAHLVRKAVQLGLGGIEELAGIPGSVGGAVTMNAGAGRQEIGDVLQKVTLAGTEGIKEVSPRQLNLGYRQALLPEGMVVLEALLQLQQEEPERLDKCMRRHLDLRQVNQGVTGANAGSVFKNPANQSAWRLIDAAGLRGIREGGAEVARQHANFIVNCGGATARDIETLIDRVQKKVFDACGVLLEPEVRIVGERENAQGKMTAPARTAAERRRE